MLQNQINKLKTITDLHRFNHLPPPEHPLISLLDYSKVSHSSDTNELKWIQSFYTMSLKRNVPGKYRYGQQPYDFDEGLMTFFAPDQIISVELIEEEAIIQKPSGWILAVHPDFLFGNAFAKKINKYAFFKYTVREALFLSEKEEKVILDIMMNISSEYKSNMDRFSQQIIISQIELLLNYAERFYQRQFLTRKKANHQILEKFEDQLSSRFGENTLEQKGAPTVHEMAVELNLSTDYLSSMLKNLTGMTTQQLIHNKLIDHAKVKLSTTDLSIGEIAFGLGFEHPQSFSKLFKSKTDQTPLQFRKLYN